MREEVAKSIIDAMLIHESSGLQRDVFSIRGDDSKVIKVCNKDVAQNVIEYEVYASLSESKQRKWMADCFYVSNSGITLIQEKLDIFTSLSDPRLPKKVPRCFTDLKIQNWGVNKDGHVKCCDYGIILLLQNKPWELKKAKFWKAE